MEWYETANALGGVEVLGAEVVSGTSFVRKVEQGLPRRALVQFKRFSGLSDSDLSEVIPRRTLTNLKSVGTLSPEQSDRIARMAGVTAHAQRVFQERGPALEWLRSPNPALGQETPLRMMRTGSGAALVDSVLTRIEYGVYE
jgi:putative toxin-antitoxin system antitoxin component (TIGR02293 family)